jgi:OOP family OmpA-OmpF porin
VAQVLLQDRPGAFTVKVTGHASRIGPGAHEQNLSGRRAEAVAKELEAAGVPASKLRTEGADCRQPLASNHAR